ncbi:choline kinase family protein [Candidatus Formimonas warabiya]|uniref:Choline kinase n=1 Tax=Formimonas warabiya TaxID=1761012 RepID=A0A3G1KZK7_FORW1|nr:choline kinase family protein [Candidatus Formimonas warabiya]ATW27962.1 choline kinase [Candidatus Formimonas warabiya]
MENKIVVDSSVSLEHIGSIFEILSKVPEFAEKNAQVTGIEVLPGGLTNYNFKVTVDGVTYAVRVAGPGTNEYLDRPAEKYNAQIMSDIGINAPIIYYDEVYGHQVCKYIDDCKTLHIPDFKENAEYLSKAAKVFRKYHTCGRSFKADFNPLKETYVYINYLKEKNFAVYEGADKMLEKVEEIKAAFDKYPQELAPCHNDPLCENWLDDNKGFYLIDWEYAGNNQPMFDLGALAIEAELSPDQERFLLKEYFGRDITEKEYGLLIINRFLCDALWTYWAVLQIATGKSHDDYWPYGLNRFNRAMELVHNGALGKALAEFK